jgi:hypothetical protein
MVEMLFWLEAALSCLLLISLLMVLISRIKKTFARRFLWIAAPIVVFAPWVILAFRLGMLQAWYGGPWSPLIGSCIGLAILLAGTRWSFRRIRRGETGTWKLGRMVLCFVASLLLSGITYWNLALRVNGDIVNVRNRAGVIAAALTPAKLPDSMNAAVQYRRANKILMARQLPNASWVNSVSKWNREGKYDLRNPEILEFLHANADVLEIIRQAGDMPGFSLNVPYAVDFDRPASSELFPIFMMGHLLNVSSQVNAGKGDMRAAAADLRACYAWVGHCLEEPLMISRAIVCSFEAKYCFPTLQELLNKNALTAEQLKSLNIDPQRSFYASLEGALCMEMAMTMGAVTLATKHMYFDLYPYEVFLWRSDMNVYLRNMERYRQLAQKPFYEVRDELKSLPTTKTRGKGGFLARIMTPHFSRHWIVFTAAEAAHRLSILAVAMEKHRLIHGTYPDALAAVDIEDGYDTRTDPFTGKPLKISINNAGRHVLYSLGSDLDDDGGRAAISKGDAPDDGDIAIILSK